MKGLSVPSLPCMALWITSSEPGGGAGTAGSHAKNGEIVSGVGVRKRYHVRSTNIDEDF
jgi:hypothetical protein